MTSKSLHELREAMEDPPVLRYGLYYADGRLIGMGDSFKVPKRKANILPRSKPRDPAWKPVSVFDALNEDFFDNGLKALTAEFGDWESTKGRGTHLLWSILGRVHELAAKTDDNTAARGMLEAAVKRLPSVQSSNRWKPDRKSSKELWLTVLLGIEKEKKATKSQWLSALNAAEKAGVPATQNDCTDWLKSVGGVSAARKTIAVRKRQPTFEEVVAELELLIDPDANAYPLDTPWDVDELPKGFGIVIVHQPSSEMKAVPLATLGDERLLLMAVQAYRKAEKKHQKQFQADAIADMREREERKRGRPKIHRLTKAQVIKNFLV